ncbi:hypothetical protein FB451DRAFT_685854 [Mycena latifolia]|nr:hypothetical protein FB451DRAFT_685854 [Mycena latifolia]
MASTSMLALFPEELLERILEAVVVAPATPHPRAPWHKPSDSSDAPRTRTAALLVCRAFHRIARPLFYHTLVLHTPSQSAALLRTLTGDPALARYVRSLVLPDLSPADADVLALVAGTLRALDIALPPTGLELPVPALPELRTLTVRKASGTYLSQPAPRAVLSALAAAVRTAPRLEHTTTTFPLSADPALGSFVSALAEAPCLHTLRTPLPALWAPALLSVSANPALQRVCLGEEPAAAPSPSYPPPSSSCSPQRPPRAATYPTRFPSSSAQKASARPVLGTGLFLAEARKHSRLADLIRAGTSVVGWRGRAWTVGAEEGAARWGAAAEGAQVGCQ